MSIQVPGIPGLNLKLPALGPHDYTYMNEYSTYLKAYLGEYVGTPHPPLPPKKNIVPVEDDISAASIAPFSLPSSPSQNEDGEEFGVYVEAALGYVTNKILT